MAGSGCNRCSLTAKRSRAMSDAFKIIPASSPSVMGLATAIARLARLNTLPTKAGFSARTGSTNRWQLTGQSAVTSTTVPDGKHPARRNLRSGTEDPRHDSRWYCKSCHWANANLNWKGHFVRCCRGEKNPESIQITWSHWNASLQQRCQDVIALDKQVLVTQRTF